MWRYFKLESNDMLSKAFMLLHLIDKLSSEELRKPCQIDLTFIKLFFYLIFRL
jgi:hypothetical protein